jgi:lambda repressor-like predicted transcriptional regulator
MGTCCDIYSATTCAHFEYARILPLQELMHLFIWQKLRSWISSFRKRKAQARPELRGFTERAKARRAFVMPRLESKGWSRCKWAIEAGVSKNSVYEYLDGRRELSKANRRALAEVLGLQPRDLPE